MPDKKAQLPGADLPLWVLHGELEPSDPLLEAVQTIAGQCALMNENLTRIARIVRPNIAYVPSPFDTPVFGNQGPHRTGMTGRPLRISK